jgi:hypothetical protein
MRAIASLVVLITLASGAWAQLAYAAITSLASLRPLQE